MSLALPFDPTKTTRSIDALVMPVKKMALDHLFKCKQQGIDLLIYCTYRCPQDQDDLFAQGRSKPGVIVTNARAGDSLHQYRVAYDCVPMRNGKPVWGRTGIDGELWEQVGAIGESLGLEWAGRWRRFREFPHFQYTGGLSLADFKAGKLPK